MGNENDPELTNRHMEDKWYNQIPYLSHMVEYKKVNITQIYLRTLKTHHPD